MKISASRSGGFAGLTEDLGMVDTAALPIAVRREFEGLVEQAGVFAGNVERLDSAVGADMYRYAVTVADEGRQTTVTFTDDGSAGTAALRRLVEQIQLHRQ
jgi:two-component sensor histidine kinase